MINYAYIYRITYSYLVRWWTPKYLRQDFWLTFVGVLIQPVATLWRGFMSFRRDKNYQLTITPQKCYLEQLLRNRWDSTLRRIYIDDGIDKPPFYLYQTAENKPVFINPVTPVKWLYTTAENFDLVDDFVVYVPMDVVFDESEMRSLLNAYKLAGTKFTIQRY